MEQLIEIIKTIHIKKYSQDEYCEIIDEIVKEWKTLNYEKILDRAGWRDTGGSG